MRPRVVVRVPASSANLGAGFDCVGVAVDRWLTVSVTTQSDGVPTPTVERAGTLAELRNAPEDDLIVTGFRAACVAAGRRGPTDIHVHADSQIPVARGLGSSGAAIVAGAAAANALLSLGLDEYALARACVGVEGHGDNVAPAVWGGAQLVVTGDDLRVSELRVSEELAFVLASPDFCLETARARKVLPRELPHRIATRAAALSAALVHGLATADHSLLRSALDDVLHVPYRKPLVPGYEGVTLAARAAGAIGATLSGSGPTIVAIAPSQAAAGVADAMQRAWGAHGVRATCFVNPSRVNGYRLTIQSTPALQLS